jgi:hypothetical protein
MPTWSGLDTSAVTALMAGFGLMELVGGAVLLAVISIYMLRKVLSAAGL